ncbi:ABC transporter permease [Streptomyces sp. NPDC056347]|uniref:ABC transporter permease n=1 Tax=Streptomyces sp. NPDC056347 TaxID=3345790 RepID=UPI0035D69BE9
MTDPGRLRADPPPPWHTRLGDALPPRYVIRRLAGTAALLLVLSPAVFALLRFAPGDPARTLLGTRSATPEALASVRAAHHLDEPFVTQYARWLTGAFGGDLGTSIRTGESVAAALGERLAVTGQLVLAGFAVALLLGLPLGVLAGLRARRPVDRAVQSLGVLALSTPAFAGGLLLIYVFSLMLGWLPAYGPGTGGTDRLLHLLLPGITLGLAVTAVLIKLVRAAVIRELAREHVTFALARGVPTRTVLFRYVLRGTAVPVTTGIGLVLAYLLAGTVLVEQVFALPGLGQLLVQSVTFKDVPVVQAEALLLAALICLATLVTDLTHPLVDPRLRTGRTRHPRPGRSTPDEPAEVKA